ncbi:hypothetical protein [Helicobacter monodelphidis]|nr:hypothetical protein [Helicobacter sp. 15-1451]
MREGKNNMGEGKKLKIYDFLQCQIIYDSALGRYNNIQRGEIYGL